MKGILDFYDVIPASGFDVSAQEAVDQFSAKGLKPSFAWQDVMRDEHKAAFTVAKMMDVDMLADVKKSLDDALANGVVFKDWADNLIPLLQQKGWWGRQAVLDPLTGETIIAQLGSPGRLKTIFRTNMQSAYAAGHWDQIEAQAEDAPYLMYDAIDDYRTRAEHKAWDGRVLPVTDKFWKTHTPPRGWNCRCSVIQLDESDLEQLGVTPDKSPRTEYYDWTNPRTGKVQKVPVGVDPNFGQAAADRVARLQKLLKEKVRALPPELEKPASESIQRAAAEKPKAKARPKPPEPRPANWRAIEETHIALTKYRPADSKEKTVFEYIEDGFKNPRYAGLVGKFNAPAVVTGKGGASYHSANKVVKMNADKGSWSGSDATFVHEYGHYLDNSIAGGYKFWSSSNPWFIKAQYDDVTRIEKGLKEYYSTAKKRLGLTEKVSHGAIHRAFAADRRAVLEEIKELNSRQRKDLLDSVVSEGSIEKAVLDVVGVDELSYFQTATIIASARHGTWPIAFGYLADAEWIRTVRGARYFSTLADLLGASTRNRYGFGHETSYYKDKENMQIEAFAQVFTIEHAGGPWLEFMEKHFPDMTAAVRALADEYKNP